MSPRSLWWVVMGCCFALGCGGSAPSSAGAFGPNDATARTTSAEAGPMAEPGSDEEYAEPEAPAAKEAQFGGAPPPAPPPAPGRPGKAEPMKPVPGQGGAQQQPGGTDKPAAVAQPLLIYTAQLAVAVAEVARSIAAVEQLARDVGGFLSRRDDTSITIRVPSIRFDESVKTIERLGDVTARRVTAEDVTEEFLDLEVRLKNARAVRARLEQLLAKATKVEESLLIQRELDRVAGEIERMEGRLKYLKDRIAFSTITVTFQSKRVEIVGAGVFRLPVPWLEDVGLRRLLSL